MKSVYQKPATVIVAIETQQIMGASKDYNFDPYGETDLNDSYETGEKSGNLTNRNRSLWDDDFEDDDFEDND